VTVAIDTDVPDEGLRICFGCGAIKAFKEFIYVGAKSKPTPDFTAPYVKFIKRMFGMRHPEPEPHPVNIYPYLNPKTNNKFSNQGGYRSNRNVL
jgi:hypothetical protein